MTIVLRKAGVSKNLRQVVALGAHRERSSHTRIGIGKKIRDRSARDRCLAELIVALENMRVDRTVRTIRTSSTEFPVVVAVVAIGTKDLRADRPRRSQPFLVQHIRQQTWLG